MDEEPKVRFVAVTTEETVTYAVDEDFHVLDPNASSSSLNSSGSFEIYPDYEPEQDSEAKEEEDPVEFSCKLLKSILRFYAELNVERITGNTEILSRSGDFIEFEQLVLRLSKVTHLFLLRDSTSFLSK